MASNRSSKAKRASRSDPTELRARTRARPAQRAAIEQAMGRQNVRLGPSPSAVGPIGRAVLLSALLVVVVLIAVWVFLAL